MATEGACRCRTGAPRINPGPRVNAEQDVVCVCLCWWCKAGVSGPAASQFGSGCRGNSPMKSLCVAGTCESGSPLERLNCWKTTCPQTTKHYIMSNSPKYSRPVNKSRIRIWSGFVKEEEEEEGRGNKRVKVWDTCGQC